MGTTSVTAYNRNQTSSDTQESTKQTLQHTLSILQDIAKRCEDRSQLWSYMTATERLKILYGISWFTIDGLRHIMNELFHCAMQIYLR